MKHIISAHELLARQRKSDGKPVRDLDMFWVTKDRKRITPQQMDDSHLINSIRLLERQAATAKLTLKLEQSIEEIADTVFPIHKVMVDELEKRVNRHSQPAMGLGAKRAINLDR